MPPHFVEILRYFIEILPHFVEIPRYFIEIFDICLFLSLQNLMGVRVNRRACICTPGVTKKRSVTL